MFKIDDDIAGGCEHVNSLNDQLNISNKHIKKWLISKPIYLKFILNWEIILMYSIV